MPKLFDIAAFGGWQQVAPVVPEDREIIAHWRRLLRAAVFLDAQSVNHAWATWLERPGDWRDELVRCIPPWTNVFVSGGIESAAGWDGKIANNFEMGVHVFSTTTARPRALSGYEPEIQERYDRAAHKLFVRTWLKGGKITRAVMMNQEIVLLDEDGRHLDTMVLSQIGPRPDSHWSFPLFVFQLLHCRNIATREGVYRPQMPKGKRNKSPKITFHSIHLTDTLVKKEGDSESQDTSEGKAKHVCRGNFAHYTEENKLFGKYVGMFWRPMHIRGNAKHGIVGKEYAMEVPSAEVTD